MVGAEVAAFLLLVVLLSDVPFSLFVDGAVTVGAAVDAASAVVAVDEDTIRSS